jgi:hypothetical protein
MQRLKCMAQTYTAQWLSVMSGASNDASAASSYSRVLIEAHSTTATLFTFSDNKYSNINFESDSPLPFTLCIKCIIFLWWHIIK